MAIDSKELTSKVSFCLVNIYFLIMLIDVTLQLVTLFDYSLLASYVPSPNQVLQTTNRTDEHIQPEPKLAQLYMSMRLHGSYYRRLTGIGIYTYASVISLILILHFYPVIHRRFLRRCIESNTIMTFLAKPEAGEKRWDQKARSLIETLIVSNRIFVREANLRRGMLFSNWRVSFDRRDTTRKKSGDAAYCEFIRDALAQHRHLVQLSKNHRLILPANRTGKQWHQKLRSFGLTFYITTSVGVLMPIFVVYFVSVEFARQALAESTLHEDRSFSTRDRLQIVLHVTFLWVVIDWFAQPLTILATIVYDLQCSLNELRHRFLSLLVKVNNLNSQIEEVSLKTEPLRTSQLDTEAIDLYCRYRLFISDLKTNLGLPQFILTQIVVFGLAPVLIMLSLIKSLSYQHAVVIGISSILVFTIGDLIFCAYSALNGECFKLTLMAWSLVAKITNTNRFVTPHTLILWCRLIHDSRCLSTYFTYKVIGIFEIGYSNIIKFNFAIVSLVLIFAGK